MKDRIKKLRKELDLTQQEFADKLGTARNNIASYETGKNAPSGAVVSLICKTFNVNETWLCEGIGDMLVEPDAENRLTNWSESPLDDIIKILVSLDADDWKLLFHTAYMLAREKGGDGFERQN